MAVLVLCKPGPPLPLLKAVVVALMFAGSVAAGVLMVPLLEHYACHRRAADRGAAVRAVLRRASCASSR
jgi:hypothetical protein